ncbi:PTS lactose/cellobiose transporter subunit IIA [Clostridium polynesiense]|uniref:PTS lactose/cellobiose transporter subunit IIA n=1 Tax=Clostridium polynesiense TaxID=1325933 RepID=UPI00058D1625|nr:PTS lactose/cellobiose transporter subunit IIA [Clostridium polynesiense]
MELEKIVFEIISHSGNAKSLCFEALDSAKNGEFNRAEELLNSAREELIKTHEIQNNMIQKEACGEKQEVSLLLLHAEDHLMTSMLAKDLIAEMIQLYKRTSKDNK